MVLGQWFREERERRGWSQARVARNIGVTPGQMCNIEKGRSRAGDEKLTALYALFETTPAQIRADMERREREATNMEQVQHPPVLSHPGIDALQIVLFGDPKQRITEAELEELRRNPGARPLLSAGHALDTVIALRGLLREVLLAEDSEKAPGERQRS